MRVRAKRYVRWSEASTGRRPEHSEYDDEVTTVPSSVAIVTKVTRLIRRAEGLDRCGEDVGGHAVGQ